MSEDDKKAAFIKYLEDESSELIVDVSGVQAVVANQKYCIYSEDELISVKVDDVKYYIYKNSSI